MTTVNSTGWNDGLLNFDPNFATDHDYNVYPTKRFYTLGQFIRFVRPGAVRHDVTGTPSNVQALAFQNHGQWQVVVLNENAAAGTARSACSFRWRHAAAAGHLPDQRHRQPERRGEPAGAGQHGDADHTRAERHHVSARPGQLRQC
jgi:hypothetical protein